MKAWSVDTLLNGKRWIRWVDVSTGTIGKAMSLVSADNVHNATNTIEANCESGGLYNQSFLELHLNDGISISLDHIQSPLTDTYGF